MADNLTIDVAITWAGAAGCGYYLYSLYRRRRSGAGAVRFLVLVLTALLLVRGFAWLTRDALLDRLTFAIASWLPLAITLVVERVLRRHHPLWVKLLALATSVGFFVTDLVADLPSHRTWLLGFLGCFALVVLINAVLLLGRRNAQLSVGEKRLANVLLLVAALSVPLLLSDFRTSIGYGPVRLGALGALLFVYVMLGSVVRTLSTLAWAARFLGLLVAALGLAALSALAAHGPVFEPWWDATLRASPVAYAWMLLTAIVVNNQSISASGSSNAFLRWLARVPLDSSPSFLTALARSPDTATHLILGPSDLSGYRLDALARLTRINDGVASLGVARAHRGVDDGELAESAEQWIDLFEHFEMTHGFLVSMAPAMVVLVNLPATTSATAAELRLSVVQHIAQRLARS